MSKRTSWAAAFIGVLTLSGVAVVATAADDAKKPADDKPKASATTAPTSQPVNKYCAVEKDNKVDPDAKTYVYKGKTIGFCCNDCIDDFKKDPEKYMKDLK